MNAAVITPTEILKKIDRYNAAVRAYNNVKLPVTRETVLAQAELLEAKAEMKALLEQLR